MILTAFKDLDNRDMYIDLTSVVALHTFEETDHHFEPTGKIFTTIFLDNGEKFATVQPIEEVVKEIELVSEFFGKGGEA